MKKLYSLLCLGALVLGACSSNDNPNPGPNPPDEGGVATGTGSLTFSYCQKEINLTTGINGAAANASIGGAIYIPAETAQRWKGNYLSGVIIGFGSSSTPEAKIFISTGKLDGNEMPTPVYTQVAEMELQDDWNEVTLDTPYEITGEGFFIGYTTPMAYGDSPLGLDMVTTSEQDFLAGNYDNGDIIGVDQLGTGMGWEHGGPWFGRVCIQAVISGDDLPLYNVGISDLFIPSFMGKDYEFPLDFYLQNSGMDAVESVTVSLEINGQEVAQAKAVADSPIASGSGAWMSANVSLSETGQDMDVVVKIIKVNDNSRIEVTEDSQITGEMTVSELSFEQNVLVEEFTGTWCGFCPRGIVGMEYMNENYGNDGFIGIAGHYNDDMVSPTYIEVVNTFSQGSYPSAVVNRTYYYDPSKENNLEYYEYLRPYPSFAGIDLSAQYDAASNTIHVSSETQFAIDSNNSPYELTFVLCQNNVGPYAQTNYFAGGSYGPLDGWENYGAVVSWIYEDVARWTASSFGITGSLPSTIKSGEKYSYDLDINAGSYNVDECFVVAILLDTTNYRVVNSAKYSLAPSTKSASDSKKSSVKLTNAQRQKIRESAR